MSQLSDNLSAWDGKDRKTINTLYQTHKNDPNLHETLLSGCLQPAIERGASWMLKASTEDGDLLVKSHIDSFYHVLLEVEHWETRLHLLQILHHYPAPDQLHAHVYQFLTHQLQDPNKFIRAWTYHALEHVARWYPQHRDEVDGFMALAMKDEAPSVKARLRQLKSV